MLKKRIIPALLLKDGRMVKGTRFTDFRDVGNPVTTARVYNAQKVDELIFLDIRPSASSREQVLNIVREAALECFMPLTAGGGVESVEDIRVLLEAGADKVAINSAAVRDPELIRRGAEIFGDQCIVASVDYRLNAAGRREVFIDSGTVGTGLDATEHILKCVEMGAGELLLTSIDHEGGMKGYDLEYIKEISQLINIPLIASGGAGRLDDFKMVLGETRASAVSAGSIFHFTDQSPIKARFYLANSGLNVRWQ